MNTNDAKKTKKISDKIVAAIISATAGVLAALIGIAPQISKMKSEVEAANEKVTSLKEENDDLKQQVEVFNSARESSIIDESLKTNSIIESIEKDKESLATKLAEEKTAKASLEDKVNSLEETIEALVEKEKETTEMESLADRFADNIESDTDEADLAAQSGEKSLLLLEPYNIHPFGKAVYNASDCLGNVFKEGLRMYGTKNVNKCYTEYYLDGKYKRISGTICVYSESIENSELSLFIYADDEKVYQSDIMTNKSEPVDFEADISSAKFIRIVAYCDQNNTGLRFLLLADPVLYN